MAEEQACRPEAWMVAEEQLEVLWHQAGQVVEGRVALESFVVEWTMAQRLEEYLRSLLRQALYLGRLQERVVALSLWTWVV